MELAIATNTDEELNRILRQWIAQKKLLLPHSDENNKPVIIMNPERVHTKGAPSKRIKSALETTKASKDTKASNMKKVCVTLLFGVHYTFYLYDSYIFRLEHMLKPVTVIQSISHWLKLFKINHNQM
jgi:hypothetical protein